jgi:hypothetical protein
MVSPKAIVLIFLSQLHLSLVLLSFFIGCPFGKLEILAVGLKISLVHALHPHPNPPPSRGREFLGFRMDTGQSYALGRYVAFHKLVPRQRAPSHSLHWAHVAGLVRPDSFIQAWVRLWRKPGEDRSMVT